MAHFTVKDGAQAQEKFQITASNHLIGRGVDCDFQILDRSVSRNHATLSIESDGKHRIIDNGSAAGTFVNEEKIKEADLSDRDMVKIGVITLEFRTVSELPMPENPNSEPVNQFTILESVSHDFEVEKTFIDAREKNSDLKLTAVYEISDIISQTFDLEKRYRKILEKIFMTVKVDRANILLIDEKTGQVIPKIGMDTHGNERNVPFSHTIVDKVIETGQSLILNNAQEELDETQSVVKHNIRSALCVPIRTRYRILGAINADASGFSVFEKSDLQLLTIIGNQAGTVIENARLIEENLQAARMAAVGQTVASLAHCIKNILQGLKGGASLVDAGLDRENIKMISNAWPVIKFSQDQISELVLNMLDYSKDRKPAYEQVHLRPHMENIYALMTSRAKTFNVTVELTYDDKVPTIQCDPMGIYRATLNLVTNAIDAVKDEEGKVLISVCPSDKAGWIEIKVSDNGPGIPDEIKKQLFTEFFSTKDSKGTGLGLAVSQKIVKEHQGEILLDSKEGKGTTFTINLPVSKPKD